MPLLWTILLILAIAAVGFVLGRLRALASAGGTARNLHSLPNYYGWNVAIWAMFPAFAALVLWLVLQPLAVHQAVVPVLGAGIEGNTLTLVMADVRRIAAGMAEALRSGLLDEAGAKALASSDNLRAALGQIGIVVGSEVAPSTFAAAETYRHATSTSQNLMAIVTIALALIGASSAYLRTKPQMRARNLVERSVLWLLIGAALIAILTTIGIVVALVFNTITFFRLYPATEFFFGLTWAPSFGGGSQLGILPLLWGTLYISFIALLVAVPVGLFSAIYLAEYASPRIRALGKPMLEVLAGIPTIVYGLFALVTVGPLLMAAFGPNGVLGLGWMKGGTAVITAGLVMGVMIIPFVSSLSDDIITAVPQSLRDGSLGLGATQSETIRNVVLPAALPGIAGAILLAASRAIGETMIVVMGAGAAGALGLNPFDAMTTITAKIVSQLTGDNDFTSPEALVAFALGMTLFVVTLGLNILALAIVRKYREQYE